MITSATHVRAYISIPSKFAHLNSFRRIFSLQTETRNVKNVRLASVPAMCITAYWKINIATLCHKSESSYPAPAGLIYASQGWVYIKGCYHFFPPEWSVHPLAVSGRYDVTLICIKPCYWWVHRVKTANEDTTGVICTAEMCHGGS